MAVLVSEMAVEMIDRLRSDVKFPDMGGAIAEGLELERQRDRGAGGEGLELVVIVGVPELAVGMVLKPG